jgi:hypothetical protein
MDVLISARGSQRWPLSSFYDSVPPSVAVDWLHEPTPPPRPRYDVVLGAGLTAEEARWGDLALNALVLDGPDYGEVVLAVFDGLVTVASEWAVSRRNRRTDDFPRPWERILDYAAAAKADLTAMALTAVEAEEVAAAAAVLGEAGAADLEPTDRTWLASTIETIEAQLRSPRPDRHVIGRSLRTAHHITAGADGAEASSLPGLFTRFPVRWPG